MTPPNWSGLGPILRAALPGPAETHFLRAAVGPRDGVEEAWRAWRAHVGDPIQALREDETQTYRALLPTLQWSLSEARVELEPNLATVLRSAALREQRRWSSYRAVLDDVRAASRQAGAEPVVVGGAAIAETLYAQPWHRHSGAIRLLLDPADKPRVERALVAAGLVRETSFLRHPSGLLVELRDGLLDWPFAGPHSDAVLRRAEVHEGLGVRGLGFDDQLLWSFGQGLAHPRTASLRWAADAALALRRSEASRRDLSNFADLVESASVALPVAILLRYLSDELGVVAPRACCDRIFDAAARSNASARATALLWATQRARLRTADAFSRAQGLRGRAYVLQWALCPPPSYVALAHGIRSRRRLSAWYLARPLRTLPRR